MARHSLFGVDIASELHSAFAGGLLPATLARTAPGTRNPSALAGGTTVGATTATYPCEGICDSYTQREIDGTRVRIGDRKILLLAKSLPDAVDPQPGDSITIEGRAWSVVNVDRDPAAATFTCQGRQA